MPRLHSVQMQTVDQLNNLFAVPDVLSFEEIPGGLTIARVTSELCDATIFLQGAHLVHWQPAGQEPVFYLSPKSELKAGKAIRGGVPVVFPWFGERKGERTDGPKHGFARTSVWELAFAAVADGDVHLTFILSPNDSTRSLGYDSFRLAYELILSTNLTLRLSVANEGDTPFHFEEAFHSYFQVGDAEQVQITGLGDTEYLDKTENDARKRQDEDTLTLHGETDRPYLSTTATVGLQDKAMNRQIAVAKRSSMTTVVWNPWKEGSAKLTDLPEDGWKKFVAVETANALENGITLRPREVHAMEAHIFLVEEEEAGS